MKKNFTLLFFLAFTCFMVKAQVPDFVATDLDSNTHVLYADYLDQGVSTILDFSATWCSPCWAAHTTHVLEDVYHLLGKEGTGDLQVFMLESDPQTPLNYLYEMVIGSSVASWGDWVTETKYPVIHEEGPSIASNFGVSGYPTIRLVCPDGNVKVNTMWGNNFNKNWVLQQVLDCKGASDSLNDARILNYEADLLTTCGESEVSIVVHNNGQNPISDLEIVVMREGMEINTMEWTGNINSNRFRTIDVGTVEMEPGATSTNFSISINSDDNNTNNDTYFTLKRAIETGNDITVKMEADNYTTADPTTFEIVDADGNALFESGSISANQTFEQTFILPELGCYAFRLIDSYGDGNQGAITITDGNGNVIADQPSMFGADRLVPFTVTEFTVTGTDEIIGLEAMSLVPNITRTSSSLQFSLTEQKDMNIVLVNNLGQKVLNVFNGTLNAGNHNMVIDLHTVPAGQYFVSMQSENGIHTEKLIKH